MWSNMSKVGNVISKYGDKLASQNPEDKYHITGNDLSMGQLKKKKIWQLLFSL